MQTKAKPQRAMETGEKEVTGEAGQGELPQGREDRHPAGDSGLGGSGGA